MTLVPHFVLSANGKISTSVHVAIVYTVINVRNELNVARTIARQLLVTIVHMIMNQGILSLMSVAGVRKHIAISIYGRTINMRRIRTATSL